MRYIVLLLLLPALIFGNYFKLTGSISPTRNAPSNTLTATLTVLENLEMASIAEKYYFTLYIYNARFFDEPLNDYMNDQECKVSATGVQFTSQCSSYSTTSEETTSNDTKVTVWYSELRLNTVIKLKGGSTGIAAGSTYTVSTSIDMSKNEDKDGSLRWMIVADSGTGAYSTVAYAFTNIPVHYQSLLSYSGGKSVIKMGMHYPLPRSTTSLQVTYPSQISTSSACEPSSEYFDSGLSCSSKENIAQISLPFSKNIPSEKVFEFTIGGLSGASTSSDSFSVTAYKSLGNKMRVIETMYYGNPSDMPEVDSNGNILTTGIVGFILMLLTII